MESRLNTNTKINLTDLGFLFQYCTDGIACKDENLKYFYVNKTFCKLFKENQPETFIGKSYVNQLSDNNLKLIRNVDLEIKNEHRSINYIITTTSGNILSINSSPILLDNKFLGILTFARDITQEENIKARFVNKHFEYIDAEKQLQKQRETFVASIGHDLKNPTIAQIRGLELLINGAFGNISSEQKELLIMILDSCRYMKGMLASLLDTYRNYGGVIKLNFTDFSMSELVKECTSEMLYVAKDKNLEIKELYDDNSDIVEADRIQIKRVIMNLLTNAIKYAFRDTPLILKIFKENNFICFEFQNNSPFIPPERQKMIFARYASFAGINKELGIGLGLYASKKIIESHNGTIYVNSSKNDQNTFGIKIPFKQTDNENREVCL